MYTSPPCAFRVLMGAAPLKLWGQPVCPPEASTFRVLMGAAPLKQVLPAPPQELESTPFRVLMGAAPLKQGPYPLA